MYSPGVRGILTLYPMAARKDDSIKRILPYGRDKISNLAQADRKMSAVIIHNLHTVEPYMLNRNFNWTATTSLKC